VRRRTGQTLVVVVAGLVLGAGVAVAGDGSSRDPAGDVHAPGLSAAQKAAVDLVAVRVTGDASLGLVVTATFRGDFEQQMGRGGLARAATALVIRPRTRAATSSGLVTSGSGPVGRLQRHTRTKTVGALRNGSRLTFVVVGPGWSGIRSATVETVLNAVPLHAFATAEDVPVIGDRAWQRFLKRSPVDGHLVAAKPRGLTCAQLANLLDDVEADLADPGLDAQTQAALTSLRGKIQRRQRAKGCGGPPPSEGAAFAWSRFSSNEVAGSGKFTGPAHTFSSVQVTLPGQYSITDHLCPTQLPNADISGNTITCGGGTLQTGQTFTLNLQTSPPPPAALGGQLSGSSGGQTFGPFTITGP
jgi:hypothetical protein